MNHACMHATLVLFYVRLYFADTHFGIKGNNVSLERSENYNHLIEKSTFEI